MFRWNIHFEGLENLSICGSTWLGLIIFLHKSSKKEKIVAETPKFKVNMPSKQKI
jgi:hypothetical protein